MKNNINYFFIQLILLHILLLQSCDIKQEFEIDIVKESDNYVLVSLPPEWKEEKTFKVEDPGSNSIALGQKWNDHLILLDIREFQITESSRLLLIDDVENKLIVKESEEDWAIYFKERLMSRFNTSENLKDGIASEFSRSGFIHPFLSPKGMLLTDDFPVGHQHQHGIFGALTFTTYRGDTIDFWNQGKKLGNVHLEELLFTYNGPLFFEINAVMNYTKFETPSDPILAENWKVRFLAEDDHNVIFIESNIANVSNDPLTVEKYLYGGLGWRGPREWNADDSSHYESEMKIITSEGLGKEEANHTSPIWLSAYGNIGNKKGGVLSFSQVGSFRYPSPVRVHPSMPYFTFAPMVSSKYSIEKGSPILTSYTFISYDGWKEKGFLEKLYKLYFFQEVK